MRIVLSNKYFYPPHLGGVEQSLLRLSRDLAARPGFTVTAVVANEGPDTVREDVEGVEVVRVGRSFAAASTPVALGYRRELRAAIKGPPPADIVHLQFPYPWGELAWLYSGATTPAVLTYHSDIVRQKLLGSLYSPFLRRVLDRVDRIIVGAPQMIENSPYLAPVAAKCRVVPFGIEMDDYAGGATTDARAAEFAAGHTRPIVLFVGRLVYYKGVDVLLRAMREVDADLVVVGTGPLEAELRQYAANNGMTDRVTFLAPMDRDDLIAWYHAADVFTLPSTAVSEAYGLVQLEAHAAGTPVVSTTLPTGVPFVNRDGVTGLTVEPGDAGALARALQKLVTDDELRERLGRQARQRALKEFTIERMTDQTIEVYDEALAMHGGAR
jgi:rhamnosyl/mannosyltransferase